MPYFLKPNLYYVSWSILIAFTISFNAYLVVYTFTLRASLRVSLFLFWRRKGNIVCVHTQTFSCFFNTFVINFDIGQRRIVFAHIMFVLRTYLTTTFCACVCFPSEMRRIYTPFFCPSAEMVTVFPALLTEATWCPYILYNVAVMESFRSFWAGHNRWPSLLVQGAGHKWVSRFSSYFF